MWGPRDPGLAFIRGGKCRVSTWRLTVPHSQHWLPFRCRAGGVLMCATQPGVNDGASGWRMTAVPGVSSLRRTEAGWSACHRRPYCLFDAGKNVAPCFT